MYKLAVIGGGPAGLYAALEGASQGLEVVLFEKDEIGSNIKCGEGYFDTLKLLEKPEAGICFKVENIIIKMKEEHRIDCAPFNLWMIDRSEWQRGLGEKARSRGVKIEEGFRIGKKELADLKEKFDLVVDASGLVSVTSRAYGFKDFYKDNCARAIQYVLEGDFSHLGSNIKVGVEPHYMGYYWVFPKGKNKDGIETANVGVGLFKGGGKISLVQELQRVLAKEGLESYKILKKQGGRIPIKPLENLTHDNIMMAGDAAGLASPLHGGGIDLACISGKVAVEEALKGGKNYRKRLGSIIGRKFSMERELYRLWEEMEYNAFEEIIGIALERDENISPNLILRYRRFWAKELPILRTFIRGLLKMDWQGNCLEGGK
ncbi:MAG: NAD(P)/FAD-dependent oxidoreductase [Candidatus Syntrophonatronum acetioxidans]|uniref:NAD(P)/FAD-dependent oxidoreductase n=1 Tax=Candidatus Syntrophonatronum acetioxidans TaxID=1795816 RepID=A0A424YAY6_9FIRM|nr:MAG: NAD(P)/FAD-dependent oxidoreductase [Candidatus Syntrophonatronum acetioxidans]